VNILVSNPIGAIKDSFFTPDVIQRIEKMGNVVWNKTTEQFDKETLISKIRDVDVLMTCWGSIRVDADIVKAAPRLKMVVHEAGSVSPIISDELYATGVRVLSGNHMFAESVAEGVIGYMIAATRNIAYLDAIVKAGGWKGESKGSVMGLLNQTIGIVGFGDVAKFLVEQLKPFHPKIKVYSRSMTDEKAAQYSVKNASIEEIFSTCKIVSLHLAQNAQTNGIIDKHFLGMLQDGALLLNTARAFIINEQDLLSELKTGRFNAVLDVHYAEPMPEDSEFRKLGRNVILMPHVVGPVVEHRHMVTHALLDDMERFARGDEPLIEEITKIRSQNMTVAV
jgi:phosphoglycerate dehydrogenase-like enzyme